MKGPTSKGRGRMQGRRGEEWEKKRRRKKNGGRKGKEKGGERGKRNGRGRDGKGETRYTDPSLLSAPLAKRTLARTRLPFSRREYTSHTRFIARMTDDFGMRTLPGDSEGLPAYHNELPRSRL